MKTWHYVALAVLGYGVYRWWRSRSTPGMTFLPTGNGGQLPGSPMYGPVQDGTTPPVETVLFV